MSAPLLLIDTFINVGTFRISLVWFCSSVPCNTTTNKVDSLHLFGGNTLPVGARVVTSGWVGLYGRPPYPYTCNISINQSATNRKKLKLMTAIVGSISGALTRLPRILKRWKSVGRTSPQMV